MQSTNAHLTSADFDQIEILILLGYSWNEASEAYFKCGRDVTKAADYLDTHMQINPKVQGHLSTLMDGKLGLVAFLGLGEDFELVEDIHELIDAEKQLD